MGFRIPRAGECPPDLLHPTILLLLVGKLGTQPVVFDAVWGAVFPLHQMAVGRSEKGAQPNITYNPQGL